ncbi:MAG: 30S ribosomal protein S27e [Candidatus Thermoplasmatota archaeon]|nr:30S ribosomal protein S27e [Candidatus Thermoplasmatota archaeon]
MTGKFIKVRCQDCNNEQVLFDRAKIQVRCAVCGTILAMPRGGKAEVKAKVIEVL